MTYTEIFQEIISIMKEDSATCKDFGAGDYQVFQSKISDDMERMEFLHVVQEYLATFGGTFGLCRCDAGINRFFGNEAGR